MLLSTYRSSLVQGCLYAALLIALAPISTAQPLNDEPNTYFPILVNAGTTNAVSVSTATATDDPQYSPSCQALSSKGVWYAVSSFPEIATITIDTVGSDFDTILSVWTVNANTSELQEVACDDDGGEGRLSLIETTLQPTPFTYYIQISGFNGQSGNSVVRVNPGAVDLGPPDDFFQRPNEALPMLFGRTHQSFNTNASEFGNDPPSCTNSSGGTGTNDIWRSFVSETNGFVTIDTFGSNFDTVLSVHDRFANEINCNDDGGTGTDSRNARIANLPVNAGLEYLVRVAGYRNSDEGSILINLSEVTGSPVANEEEALPEALVLDGVYPNPFSTEATVSYTLGAAAPVLVEAYDLLGRRVATLADGLQAAGPQALTWTADGLPAGVYVIRVQSKDRVETTRATVLH
ncbi:MAG: T9SS type A sorting domain-containing protein [Bacteroidota bacterium]